jgi:hypothetical protein
MPRGGARPLLAEACHHRQRAGWGRGRLDETSSQVPGAWRARAQLGPPRAVWRTAQRAQEAARRLLQQARRRQGCSAMRPIEGSEAPDAARQSAHAAHGPPQPQPAGASRH